MITTNQKPLLYKDELVYCTTCGRGFLPQSVSHKYDKMRPTCSINCQHEYETVMDAIFRQTRRFFDTDDELNWEG